MNDRDLDRAKANMDSAIRSLRNYDRVNNRPGRQLVNAMPRVGRNDLCPCGSKRKFKHCCLTK